MNINQLETLNDQELFELESKVAKDISKTEVSKFSFNPYHKGGKTIQQRVFYEHQNQELIKLNRFRKAINAELDKRTNPLNVETITTTVIKKPTPFKVIAAAVEPIKPKIVYKAPVEEEYMLAKAFITIAQKALPAAHYQRLLALSIDRRKLESNRPMSLMQTSEER